MVLNVTSNNLAIVYENSLNAAFGRLVFLVVFALFAACLLIVDAAVMAADLLIHAAV